MYICDLCPCIITKGVLFVEILLWVEQLLLFGLLNVCPGTLETVEWESYGDTNTSPHLRECLTL